MTMDRNRILYFIIGVVIAGLGYALRVMQVENYYRGSAILIAMGIYFILTVLFKRANAFVLFMMDVLLCGGLHLIRLANIPWYNYIYDSPFGTLVIGGPYNTMILVYVLCGTILGLFFEMVMRQYNKIGLGD